MANPVELKPFTINEAIWAFVGFFRVHASLRPSRALAIANSAGTWLHLLDVIDPTTGEVWADKLVCRIWDTPVVDLDEPISPQAVFIDLFDAVNIESPVLSLVLVPSPTSCFLVECVDRRPTQTQVLGTLDVS